jgi:lipoprotein NlpD
VERGPVTAVSPLRMLRSAGTCRGGDPRLRFGSRCKPGGRQLVVAGGRHAGRALWRSGGKGIDIVGQRNAPVIAVAPGKVVYSGSGLRGYGQLLIVKHAGEFLSAYAHNETILVKEGDTVTAGQSIALMGDSDADRVKLHFEIRRYGKPLDPLNYLPERS